MLKEVTKFIENLSLGPPWSNGVNLFAGHIPVKNKDGDDTPERYLAILENAGGTLLVNVGGVVTATPPSASGDETYWPEYIEKAVQLLNRAKSFFTARDDAMELFDALNMTAGRELPSVNGGPNYVAVVIDAYGPPAPIENPGERGLFLFSTNYIFKIEEATCGT